MQHHRTAIRKHPLKDRAVQEPSRLSQSNSNFWQDMCEVLLDSGPPPWELEVVRRWLRDQVEDDLTARVGQKEGLKLLKQACRLEPRLIWKLPYSRAAPSASYHRRIVAILLPHELRMVEGDLARLAFREGL